MARIVYTDMSGQERAVPLGPDCPVVTIGRATDCTIRSNRKSVSRRHAEFRYTNGNFEVIDLNSSNGTYLMVDEERKPVLGREYLAHNDEVWCGDFIVRFYEEEGGRDSLDDHTLQPDRPAPPGPPPLNTGPNPFAAPANGAHSGPSSMPPQQPAGAQGGWSPRIDDWSPPQDSPPPIDVLEEFGNETRQGDISAKLERLVAEKQSIEDLASRQASEIDDLQARIKQLTSELEKFRAEDDAAQTASRAVTPEEYERVKSELEYAKSELRVLEGELTRMQQQRQRIQELEEELEAMRRNNERILGDLEGARQKLDEMRETGASDDELDRLRVTVDEKNRDISTLEGEVERLAAEVESYRAKLDEVARQRDDGSKAREEVEALRRELERHKRLVEEFERRNRELQAELDRHLQHAEALETTTAEQHEKLQTMQGALETLSRERDEACAELEELRAAGSVEDLRNEIEGLKRRLRAKKDSKEVVARLKTRIEELEAQNERLSVELAQAAQPLDSGGAETEVVGEVTEAVDTVLLGALRDKLELLDRVVDAVARADLEALSTVDRIRLQSALRDTNPKDVLAELRALVSD